MSLQQQPEELWGSSDLICAVEIIKGTFTTIYSRDSVMSSEVKPPGNQLILILTHEFIFLIVQTDSTLPHSKGAVFSDQLLTPISSVSIKSSSMKTLIRILVHSI